MVHDNTEKRAVCVCFFFRGTATVLSSVKLLDNGAKYTLTRVCVLSYNAANIFNRQLEDNLFMTKKNTMPNVKEVYICICSVIEYLKCMGTMNICDADRK